MEPHWPAGMLALFLLPGGEPGVGGPGTPSCPVLLSPAHWWPVLRSAVSGPGDVDWHIYISVLTIYFPVVGDLPSERPGKFSGYHVPGEFPGAASNGPSHELSQKGAKSPKSPNPLDSGR